MAKYLQFGFCSAESLAPDLHELLKKNGLSVESLEKAVLMQVVTMVTMEVVMVMMRRECLSVQMIVTSSCWSESSEG